MRTCALVCEGPTQKLIRRPSISYPRCTRRQPKQIPYLVGDMRSWWVCYWFKDQIEIYTCFLCEFVRRYAQKRQVLVPNVLVQTGPTQKLIRRPSISYPRCTRRQPKQIPYLVGDMRSWWVCYWFKDQIKIYTCFLCEFVRRYAQKRQVLVPNVLVQTGPTQKLIRRPSISYPRCTRRQPKQIPYLVGDMRSWWVCYWFKDQIEIYTCFLCEFVRRYAQKRQVLVPNVLVQTVVEPVFIFTTLNSTFNAKTFFIFML